MENRGLFHYSQYKDELLDKDLENKRQWEEMNVKQVKLISKGTQ